MTQEEFNAALTRNKAEAEKIAAELPTVSDESVLPLLQAYIRHKYLLDEGDITTDNLLKLGKLSNAKLIGIRNAGLNIPDQAAGCTSASSEAIKQVLLVMALGKILGTKFDPDEAARVRTIGELAELFVKVRRRKG